MSSSDEEDYMSDAFLNKMTAEDVRPGLCMSRTTARKIEIDVKKQQDDEQNREAHKSIKVLEKERREEGLNTALSSDSKGFAMLAKLGYKSGDTIGRSTAGISEPIKMEVKLDRGGLGKRSAQEQLLKELRTKRSAGNETEWTDISKDFRQRIAEKRREKEIRSTLYKCQKVCQSLDVAVNVEIPIEEWYWPPIHDEQTRDDSDDEPKDESDESEYDSDSELSNQENDSDDDQIDKALRRRKKKKESTQKEKEETKEQEENEEKIEVNIEDQVNTLLNHLRTKYFYCVWCGIQYNDETDINNKCPGVDKDDH